ncbi:MAG: hypothetical protein PUC01_05360 [Spirochaetales bacterium]|nr:hypothetical protein [Spirochaetales bacterium]
MDKGEIRVGTLIERLTDNTTWRVICIINKACRMINTISTGLDFLDMNYEDIQQGIILNHLVVVEESIHVYDISNISERVKDEFNRKRNFLRFVDSYYGPSYSSLKSKTTKPEYNEALKINGISHSAAQRLIVRWLQSGFQEISIINPKMFSSTCHKPYEYKVKTGRKAATEQGILIDDKCTEAFEYGLELYSKQRLNTLHDCFAVLLSKYYSINTNDRIELLPIDQRPTEKQFRYYVDKSLSYKQKQIIKTSIEEFRNNERLLFSTPSIEALQPGYIVEADALEVDIMLVSSIDQTKVVGRPILYMMIDIYSHCIVAFSVSFENNSLIGLSNLMVNLFESKTDFLKKHNVTNFNPDLWPSNFIPGEIRCDRGSDFESKDFERMCCELNMNLTFEPGATGSMKGSIEQSFRLYHQTFKAELENKGVIQKRYDSKHKIQACLTIEEMIKITILFVAYHNGKYSKRFKITPKMMRAGVTKTPVSIWNYGVEKIGRQIEVPESRIPEIMYKLMMNDTAAITRQGIHYKGLYYLPFGDDRLTERIQLSTVNAKIRDTNGVPLNSLQIKKDPRLVDYLYYRNEKDNRVMKLLLNPAKSGSYRGMSWNEYDEYYRHEKHMDKVGEADALQRLVDRQQGLKAITEPIEKVSKEPSAKNMRDNRRIERNLVNTQNAISERIPNIGEEERVISEAAPMPVLSVEDTDQRDEKEPKERPVSPLLSDNVPEFFLQ